MGEQLQNQKIRYKSTGLIAKIPVVIAEPKIQVDVETTITLESPALEIKRILKKLFLTQCELIPTDDRKSGKLFISGYVRKNIEYATAVDIAAGTVSGEIRHTTVNVPFSSIIKINYLEMPDFEPNKGPVQLEVINDDNMSSDPFEQNLIQTEIFNEKVFCELVEAKFREKDLILNPTPVSAAFPDILVFTSFIEKMVVDVTLKILQKQQVEIPKVYKKDECEEKYEEHCRYGEERSFSDKKAAYWKE